MEAGRPARRRIGDLPAGRVGQRCPVRDRRGDPGPVAPPPIAEHSRRAADHPGALTGGGIPTSAPASFAGSTVTRNAAAQHLQPASGDGATSAAVASGGATIRENAWSIPYSGGGSPLLSFPYFPLYTLDYIQGSVLFPGGYQLATLDGNVDLRAQAMNSTGVTYSWDTTNLTHATGITVSGTGNYDLTFTWDDTVTTAAVDSVTLTATNSSSQQETQTYYFEVPTGSITTPPAARAGPARSRPTRSAAGDPSWTATASASTPTRARSTPRSRCRATTRTFPDSP